MRIHQTEEMLTNMKEKVKDNPIKVQANTSSSLEATAMDSVTQEKIQAIENRVVGVQQRMESLNPVFLLTLETRLESLQGDLVELRNLYSSPTSSLNLVLDGLLKKVKDMEAGK